MPTFATSVKPYSVWLMPGPVLTTKPACMPHLRGEAKFLASRPSVVVYQHRLNLRLWPALLERYVWGRSFAAVRVSSVPFSRRAILTLLCPLLPFVLLWRQFQNVRRTGRNRAAFLRALPLTLLLDVVWSSGEFVGYLTGHP